MQTRSLRTLVQIARSGSFAAAAAHLNMTLSAVSMQIKGLETQLDTQLFDRAHRPPRLTPMGRVVCTHAQRLLEQEAGIHAACHRDGTLSGRFRIGFVATASIRLLPDFLDRAGTQAPAARFDIETGVSETLEGKVLNGQLDAAVVTASDTPASGLRYVALQRERMVLVRPSDATGTDIAAICAGLPFFHFQSSSGIGKVIADHMAPHMPADARVIYLDSVEAIMECVNRGLGFTVLPEPDVRRTIGPGTRVAETDRPLWRTLALALVAGPGGAAGDQLCALFASPAD